MTTANKIDPSDLSLAEFFASGPRSLRAAKRTLLLALGSVGSGNEVLDDLSADTLAVSGNDVDQRVYYRTCCAIPGAYGQGAAGAADARPPGYAPPEGYSDPWKVNQYSLGVTFHAALSRQTGGPRVATPIGHLVPELSGAFSVAISRMTAADPELRFPTVQAAQKFVEGIVDRAIWPYMVGALLAFLTLAAGSLYFLLRSNETQVDADPAPSPRPGMAGVSHGESLINGKPVAVADLYLDSHEVTVAQYLAFAKSRAKPNPFEGSDYTDQYPSHPVWNVSWDDARDYCSQAGKRLPTEAEWVRAYETGNYSWATALPRSGQANVAGENLMDVGRTQEDRTATGIFDLAGNLPEWTSDDYPGEPMKIVRGGGFYLDASLINQRMGMPPKPAKEKGYLRVGFRCAAD